MANKGTLAQPASRVDPAKYRGGFTVVEVMIVVASIALIAAIAVPNFLRGRKRSQATRILNDLRMIDAAVDQYAIENNKAAGASVTFTDIKGYIKSGTSLYKTGQDVFGQDYTIPVVDSLPSVPSATYMTLSDVAPAAFWSPYGTGS